MRNQNGFDKGNIGPEAQTANEENCLVDVSVGRLTLVGYESARSLPPISAWELFCDRPDSMEEPSIEEATDRTSDFFRGLCGNPAGYKGFGEGGLLDRLTRGCTDVVTFSEYQIVAKRVN
jgi:hypothetical protein